jgi:hypothetical protein
LGKLCALIKEKLVMTSTRTASAVLAVLLIGSTVIGCRTPNLSDRMDDAGEMFRFNIAYGPGLLANVHVTRALALGLGTYETRRCGFRNGYGWSWDERRYDMNLIVPIYGWEDVTAVQYGGMPLTQVYADQKDLCCPEAGFCSNPRLTINNPNRGWLEVSANVHLIWLGLEAGVDVGEILDWAFGWFGLDLAGDDRHTGENVEKHDPPSPPPPRYSPAESPK